MQTVHYSPCTPTNGGCVEMPSFVVPVSDARTSCSAPLKLFICAAIAITGGTNASAFHKRVPADQVSPNIGPTTIYAGTDRHRNAQSVRAVFRIRSCARSGESYRSHSSIMRLFSLMGSLRAYPMLIKPVNHIDTKMSHLLIFC